ncbi:MAG: ribonuclease HII, partial [Salegentibacter mishustinae]|nr:ribonuclease HII [Salegentibacter mishustinae]
SINTEKTDFSENHSIVARPNLLVSLSENILKIKGKEISLDYGLYTAPEIFYVNNKYYISLTDLQTQKVFVFDSNAELLPGFPVYGTSGIILNNADIDQRPEFVVKGGDKEILMYKL